MDSGAVSAVAADVESWTVRRVLAQHRLLALGVAAFVALMLAMILVAVVGSKGGPVTDATTCTQWGSTNLTRQTAYARLYVREHGALADGASSPASVVAAINTGCVRAYNDDVSDNATVVQAISGGF